MPVRYIPSEYRRPTPSTLGLWAQQMQPIMGNLLQNLLSQQMWKERFKEELPVKMFTEGYRQVEPMKEPMESWAEPGAVTKIGGKYWEKKPEKFVFNALDIPGSDRKLLVYGKGSNLRGKVLPAKEIKYLSQYTTVGKEGKPVRVQPYIADNKLDVITLGPAYQKPNVIDNARAWFYEQHPNPSEKEVLEFEKKLKSTQAKVGKKSDMQSAIAMRIEDYKKRHKGKKPKASKVWEWMMEWRRANPLASLAKLWGGETEPETKEIKLPSEVKTTSEALKWLQENEDMSEEEAKAWLRAQR